MKIAVVEKCFAALEAMSELGRVCSLKELAEINAIPKPTLHRILQTLMDLGYVEQDQTRSKYQITMQLAHLGRSYNLEGLKQKALPLMESLHQRFNETVNLGMLQGAYVCYIHFIETTQNLRAQVHPGARDPFHSTALGRAIVANLSPERQEALLERAVLTPRTAMTVVRTDVLRAVLRDTNARGWALDDQENDIGVVCMGVPLLEDGRPVASISVSVPKSRLPLERQQDIVSALLALSDPPPMTRLRKKAGVAS